MIDNVVRSKMVEGVNHFKGELDYPIEDYARFANRDIFEMFEEGYAYRTLGYTKINLSGMEHGCDVILTVDGDPYISINGIRDGEVTVKMLREPVSNANLMLYLTQVIGNLTTLFVNMK